MAHICKQIICPVMNGKLKYRNSCVRALLKDSLTEMSLKEIRLNMDVGKGLDSEDEPPEVVVAATRNMITQAFQKAMIDNVMPSLRFTGLPELETIAIMLAAKQELPDNTTRIPVDETGAVNPSDVPSAVEEELLQSPLPSNDGEKLEALPEEDRNVDVPDAHIADMKVLLSPTGNQEPDSSTGAHSCEVEP
ncbi:hypothetical protein KIN20_025465 [Parelaphostrongylus tenuis]|uniref:Uncharacterized protein n=1 Tax=Parelaphostrongylus tenuis TaxID=148309 RepID=A0AAD5N8V4_PARTN|nr:hypothetical protein KIN20_025465 [Parelaphostrongylus tenuis]